MGSVLNGNTKLPTILQISKKIGIKRNRFVSHFEYNNVGEKKYFEIVLRSGEVGYINVTEDKIYHLAKCGTTTGDWKRTGPRITSQEKFYEIVINFIDNKIIDPEFAFDMDREVNSRSWYKIIQNLSPRLFVKYMYQGPNPESIMYSILECDTFLTKLSEVVGEFCEVKTEFFKLDATEEFEESNEMYNSITNAEINEGLSEDNFLILRKTIEISEEIAKSEG